MVTRYFEAIQCLNSVARERSPEALKCCDARAGRRPFQGCDSGLLGIVFFGSRRAGSVVPPSTKTQSKKVRNQ